MSWIQKAWNLYEGYKRISIIFKNMYSLQHITLDELNNTTIVENIKNQIMSSGCLGIKFIQWYLSHTQTKEDPVSQRICTLFEDIYEQCPYHDLEHTRNIVRLDYSTELEDLFDMREFKVIASGSIGQVYLTKMKDSNLTVAVKVKHPNLELELAWFAPYLGIIKRLQTYKFIRNKLKLFFDINDFIQNLNLQIDFKNEAINASIFAENFADNHMVIIPRVHMYSTNIIVSRYEPGCGFNELTGYQRYKAMLNLTAMIHQMILIDDFTHGDLHIKNWKLRVEPDGIKIIIYDHGICTRTGNLEFNRRIWNSFITEDVSSLTGLIDEMFIGEIAGDARIELNRFCGEICEHFKTERLNLNYLLIRLLEYMSHHDLVINKVCLHIIVIISIIEHVFIQNNIITYRSVKAIDPLETVYTQRMEIINYAKCYGVYDKVRIYLEDNIDERLKNKGKINLFNTIGASNLVFTPIE